MMLLGANGRRNVAVAADIGAWLIWVASFPLMLASAFLDHVPSPNLLEHVSVLVDLLGYGQLAYVFMFPPLYVFLWVRERRAIRSGVVLERPSRARSFLRWWAYAVSMWWVLLFLNPWVSERVYGAPKHVEEYP